MITEKKTGGLLQRAASLKDKEESPAIEIKKRGLLYKAESVSKREDTFKTESVDVMSADKEKVDIKPVEEKKVEIKPIEVKPIVSKKDDYKPASSVTGNRTPFIKINPFEKNQSEQFSVEKKEIKQTSEVQENFVKKTEKNTFEEKKEDIKTGQAAENTSEVKIKVKFKRNKMNKTLFKIIFILFIVLFFIAGFIFGYKKIIKGNEEKNHALVDRQLILCQEFVTAKYRYSDIVIIKKSIAFAKSYSIVKYEGIIRVGINNLTDVEYSVSKDGKSVSINLPKVEVLGNEISSQEVFDESQSIFIPIKTQEVFDEIENAKNDAVNKLIAEGALEEARSYAIKLISQFMHSAGFEEVIIQ